MYNYREAMTEDVKQWITDEVNLADWTEDRGGLEQQLNDDLWTADSVTGNGSGSYTFNRVQASLYVLDNMDLLQKAINEFATDPATVGNKFISEDWEWFDVTIRCYLLGSVISDAMKDLFEKNIVKTTRLAGGLLCPYKGLFPACARKAH